MHGNDDDGTNKKRDFCALFVDEKCRVQTNRGFKASRGKRESPDACLRLQSDSIYICSFAIYVYCTQIRKYAFSQISLNCSINIRIMQKAQNRLCSLRQYCFHFIRGFFYSHDSFYEGINYANSYHDFIQLHSDCKSKLHTRTQTAIFISRNFAQFSNAYLLM